MAALVFGEVVDGALSASVRNAMAAAAKCASHVDVVLLGAGISAAASQAAALEGCRSVLVVQDESLHESSPEEYCGTVATLAREYTHLIATSTYCSRGLLPRVAAELGVAMASEVVEVISQNEFRRFTYASNALAKVELLDNVKIFSIRATAFPPVKSTGGSGSVQPLSLQPLPDRRSTVSVQRVKKAGRPDLANAKVIVAAGRGLKAASDFPVVEALADLLGGAVAASRPLVDMGYIGSEYQVGQTGKVVAPELYFAVGVSGAIQHIAGMKDSKVIVAINSDPDAPIFQYATYGLTGDLYEVVPSLCRALKAEFDNAI